MRILLLFTIVYGLYDNIVCSTVPPVDIYGNNALVEIKLPTNSGGVGVNLKDISVENGSIYPKRCSLYNEDDIPLSQNGEILNVIESTNVCFKSEVTKEQIELLPNVNPLLEFLLTYNVEVGDTLNSMNRTIRLFNPIQGCTNCEVFLDEDKDITFSLPGTDLSIDAVDSSDREYEYILVGLPEEGAIFKTNGSALEQLLNAEDAIRIPAVKSEKNQVLSIEPQVTLLFRPKKDFYTHRVELINGEKGYFATTYQGEEIRSKAELNYYVRVSNGVNIFENSPESTLQFKIGNTPDFPLLKPLNSGATLSWSPSDSILFRLSEPNQNFVLDNVDDDTYPITMRLNFLPLRSRLETGFKGTTITKGNNCISEEYGCEEVEITGKPSSLFSVLNLLQFVATSAIDEEIEGSITWTLVDGTLSEDKIKVQVNNSYLKTVALVFGPLAGLGAIFSIYTLRAYPIRKLISEIVNTSETLEKKKQDKIISETDGLKPSF